MPAAGERKKRRKRRVDADVDDAGEEAPAGPKSESEGDTTMDEDDNRDGCAESSHQEQGKTYGPAVHPPSGDTSFYMHETKIVGSVVWLPDHQLTYPAERHTVTQPHTRARARRDRCTGGPAR